MKNRIIFLVLLFIAAFAVYFVVYQKKQKTATGVLYTTIEEPSFPVVWADTCGEKMNCMRGYIPDAENGAADTFCPDIAADTLTILPSDRRLTVHIEDSTMKISKIRYEIRSADLSELIEQTTVADYVATEKGQDVTLPIQNLIDPGKEYRLEIILTTEKGDIRYYSRIAFDEKGRAADMVALADGFSSKNFDYNSARDNATYLESNETGDNTTLGKVTLKSSYSQLTYGKLGLSPIGQRDVRLTEYNGSMGIVRINSMASGNAGDGSGTLYEISESFSMRMGPERIYMMDYTRTMHEVFMGNADCFSGERIVLGISEDSAVQSVKSPGGKYTAFVSARDLWLMNGNTDSCTKIYSFRSGTDSGIRSNFEKHDIKALSADDDGSLEFILYGYMNRGEHEGHTGIAIMHYDAGKNTLTEQAFIPSGRSFEELDADMKSLSYLGANSMLYLKIGNGFYGIDTKSNETIIITNALHETNYAVSAKGNRIAWQDTEDATGSPTIHFMNLDTGEKKDLNAGTGQLLKPVGFIDLDLAVGVEEEGNVWNINGIDREIPFTAIEIVNDELVSQEHYEKKGYFLTKARVDQSRIHLTLLTKSGDHAFANGGEDTIVCNAGEAADDSVQTYTTDTTEKTWFIPLAFSLKNKTVTMNTPGSIDYDNSDVLKPGGNENGEKVYYAWGHGKLIGTYENFGSAVNAAYDEMGYVRSGGNLVYCRAATAGIRTLSNPDTAAAAIMPLREQGKLSDLYGISLKEALYFVSRGLPVLGYSDAGDPLLVYAYDRTEVSLYEIKTGQYRKMNIDEAETMFGNGHNDFSCNFTNP